MRYHKLKAGECPGTYLVTEPVTEQDLLRIANQIARKRLAKGSAITSTTEAAERLLLRSCFVALSTAPVSTHGKWSNGPCYSTAGPSSRCTITPVVTRNPATPTASSLRPSKRPWRWSMCDYLTIWWSVLRA